MPKYSRDSLAANGPRTPERRHSYDENLDEPAKLIENEPVDTQTETPEQGNVPVESIERDDQSSPPAFEDDATGNQ